MDAAIEWRSKLVWQAGSLRSCPPSEVFRRCRVCNLCLRVGTSLILVWFTQLKGPTHIIPPTKHRISASQIIITTKNFTISVRHLSARKIFQWNWTQRTIQAPQSYKGILRPSLSMNLIWSRHSPNPSSKKISRRRNHKCKPVKNSGNIKIYWQRHLNHLIILS